jgi:putative Ca2+/H+ antiporter (TMEM165/GDT1 family)
MEFLIAAVTAFLLVIPVELPDKTFVATLVLSTRYRPWPVWIGVALAFGIQSLVAVVAGHLVSLLPDRPVQFVAAALFAVGGFILLASAGRAVAEERKREREYEGKVKNVRRSALGATFASFGVLFVAEWGDLSQLLTAGLVARGMEPVAVFAGSWAALAVIAGGAVVLGRVLMRYVSLTVIQYVGAAVCGVLTAVTLVDAFT